MRKRRTREHIIADLSVNHIERHVLRAGHTVQRLHFDYGYDLFVQTFDEHGGLEPGYILLQLKATDAPGWVAERQAVAVVLERRDLETWRDETSPVFLSLYAAAQDEAYWLFLDRELLTRALASSSGESVTLRIPSANLFNEMAVARMQSIKNVREGNDDSDV